MTEQTTITATVLVRSISDVLNRVLYRGERFIVQRGGKTIARLGPIKQARPISLAQLASHLEGIAVPDRGFFDDLEQIQLNQPDEEEISWSSS